jgi:hypothetical protein
MIARDDEAGKRHGEMMRHVCVIFDFDSCFTETVESMHIFEHFNL